MDRSLAHTLVAGRIYLLVHGPSDPTDEEWSGYLDTLVGRVRPGAMPAFLIVTEGGGPNSVQRTDMNERFDIDSYGSVKTAVVTRSRVARGIVTALRWFNPGIKAFEPAKLDEAMGYLELTEEERALVLQEVERLRGTLDLEPLRAA